MNSFNNIPPRNLPFVERLTDAVSQLVDVFRQRKTSYALIGGLGVALRGHSRTTVDVDFLLTVPQLELPRLLETFVELGCQLDVVDSIRNWNEGGMLTFRLSSGIQVDWLKPVIPTFHKIIERAKEERFAGHVVRVADAESLLFLKLIAFRLQDQSDIQAILAANVGKLGLDWVRQEALSAGISPQRLSAFEGMVREFYES